MAPVINPQRNPTYAILDSGSTRSMGSWHASQRFTAGVARMKSHGEIAIKGLTNYVYDDDNSIRFVGDFSRVQLFVQKEDLATQKTIGSQKQDHWILDKKNKQLIRVRILPRKALFTPNRAKECPINPDSISRERTTEIIDASKGGDPDILEDSWRLTSQANKPMINLWIGKTIFTFANNSLEDEEAGSGSAADRIIDKKGRSTIEPDPSHHPQKNQRRFRLH